MVKGIVTQGLHGHWVSTARTIRPVIVARISAANSITEHRIFLIYTNHFGFDKNGFINRWKVNDYEDGNPHPLVTSRGIQPGKSTLSDVIKEYGTGGYSGNNILEYVFEIDPLGVLQPITDRRFTRHNTDGYILSFIFDRETKVVWNASVMTYKYAYYDFYDSF